ncbi:MAG: hypothetical protein K0B85_01760 [Coriobacteriia bacterium]|nr:hypothetical protein [Coriobacteriia bacterium]
MLLAKRWRMLIVCTVLMALVVFGAAACGSDQPDTIAPDTPGTVEPDEPDGGEGAEVPATDADRTLVEAKCSGCHNLDRVWAVDQDRAGWEATVSRMEANGLQVSEDERAAIIEYLASQ